MKRSKFTEKQTLRAPTRAEARQPFDNVRKNT